MLVERNSILVMLSQNIHLIKKFGLIFSAFLVVVLNQFDSTQPFSCSKLNKTECFEVNKYFVSKSVSCTEKFTDEMFENCQSCSKMEAVKLCIDQNCDKIQKNTLPKHEEGISGNYPLCTDCIGRHNNHDYCVQQRKCGSEQSVPMLWVLLTFILLSNKVLNKI